MMIHQMAFMRLLSTAVLVLYIPFMAFSQSQTSEQDANLNPDDKELTENHEIVAIPQEKLNIRGRKKLKFNYYTGTNILFSKRYGSASNIYLGTSASYPFTPRFTMEFGTAVNFYRLTGLTSGLYPDNRLSQPNVHTTSVTLYTRGSYFLSSRLTLSGMAFKHFSPNRYPSVNPGFVNYNQEGMSLGLDYRLFQNLHIGAQFSYIKNDGPFYPSRLTQPVIDNYYR